MSKISLLSNGACDFMLNTYSIFIQATRFLSRDENFNSDKGFNYINFENSIT